MKNVLAEVLLEVTRPQLVAWESHCEHKLEVALKEQDKLKREYKTADRGGKKGYYSVFVGRQSGLHSKV